jgi:hypothetical protein
MAESIKRKTRYRKNVHRGGKYIMQTLASRILIAGNQIIRPIFATDYMCVGTVVTVDTTIGLHILPPNTKKDTVEIGVGRWQRWG